MGAGLLVGVVMVFCECEGLMEVIDGVFVLVKVAVGETEVQMGEDGGGGVG